MLTDEDLTRFARQIILPGFGEESQLRLAASHVAVIGAGGLGSPVIQYLAAAGIGRLTIIDDDVVEASNLNRQTIHPTSAIDNPKAASAAEAVRAINPHCAATAINARFTADNAAELLGDASVIADCSDRFETRHAAARACHDLRRVMVFGGAVGLGGQVAAFASHRDADSPCFACIFPAPPDTTQLPRCSEAGIPGPVTGIIGSMMALEVMRHCVLNQDDTATIDNNLPLGEPLFGKLILYDGMANSFSEIGIAKNPDCKICGNK